MLIILMLDKYLLSYICNLHYKTSAIGIFIATPWEVKSRQGKEIFTMV